jgi:hypothetical protein
MPSDGMVGFLIISTGCPFSNSLPEGEYNKILHSHQL